MAYCPECGEQITSNDTFCAYCGISLSPVVPDLANKTAQQADAVPHENALNISDGSLENKEPFGAAANVNDEAPAADEKAPADAPIFEEQSALKDFGINPFTQAQSGTASAQDAADRLPVDTDVSPAVEVSVADSKPSLREVNSVNSDPENPATVSAFNKEDKSPSSSAEREKPENYLPVKTVAEISEASEIPADAATGTPVNSVSPTEDETPNPAGDSYNAEFEKTVPYIPSEMLNEKAQAAEKAPFESPSSQSNSSEKEPDFGYKSFSMMPTPDLSGAISMPETPIESSAQGSLEPKLVSVNILPDFSSAAQDSVSGENAREYTAPAVPENPSVAFAPIVPANREEKEARSYTSPNIGMTETDGKKSAKLKPLEEGTVLNGRYEIVRKIGGGGMGAVYLASDRNLGGVLRAVKEMVQSYIEDTQQEKAVNDFRRESLLLTSLEHPSIPTIFDYFYDEKECRFYLVMKYISGGDLAARLKSSPEGRIDEKTVTEWAIQIADVLDYLHNRQPPIVYRDLKPSNVMIDGNSGRVMIIDFGIARWVNKEEKGVTAVGTMGYAPPELFSGNVEPRSDIYSLGSTMFHLLTGADPQSNPLLIFDFHKNPRPRQINSRLSDQMEKILVRAVEYNAEHRFKSAAELRDALSTHLAGLKNGAVTYGTGEPAKPAPVAANHPVFCGFCGQKILVTDLFCPFCGAQQPTAGQSAALKPVFPGSKQTARLMVIGTSDLDSPQFNLEKENNLVGRRDPMSNIFPEIDLSKFDPQTKISRRHARIWRESTVYMLEDLGSSNGTVLISPARENLRLLPHQPQILSSGDKIRIGDTMLRFFVG